MAVLEVDRKGLAKQLANRPKAFILYELVQNGWDETVTKVEVTAKMLPNRPVCAITVEDDSPEGFEDLKSVYTLFRASKKAPDPTKRGRFELGEKLVIAHCNYFKLETTKGTVIIEGDERTVHPRKKLDAGTRIYAEFKMTRPEFDEMMYAAGMLTPPDHCVTTINGERLRPRKILFEPQAQLQTIRVDDDGNLKPTARNTTIRVYDVRPGEAAHIFEMGIPIVATGDKWHYDVQQRVPMNWDRNAVSASFLQNVRVAVMNAGYEHLEEDDVSEAWVNRALEDERVEKEAFTQTVAQRYGEDAVAYDPSDPEGSKISMSEGRQVVHGGSETKGFWENSRRFGALPAAGKVTPGPKTGHSLSGGGDPERELSEDKWTPGMRDIADWVDTLGWKLLDRQISCRMISEPTALNCSAYWEDLTGTLTFNYGRLGKKWFDRSRIDADVLRLIIHEFGHAFASDHLTKEYHDGLTKLGVKLAKLALAEPELFR
jgi:hypothetical protein